MQYWVSLTLTPEFLLERAVRHVAYGQEDLDRLALRGLSTSVT